MTALTRLVTTGVTEMWALIFSFLAFLILAIVLFFFANRAGRGAFVAFIASLYIGFALYILFPYAKVLTGSGALSVSLLSLVLYAVCVGISYFIFHKHVGVGFLSMGTAGILILALLTAGFLMALAYHSFSLGALYNFSPAMEAYFAPAQYFFWWFIAPLVGLLIIAR